MKLLAEEKEIVDKPDAGELKDARGEMELEHVRMALLQVKECRQLD